MLFVTLWASLLVLAGAYAAASEKLPVWEVAGFAVDLNLPPGKPLFDVLTDFAMFGAIIFETSAVATIFVLRRGARWRSGRIAVGAIPGCRPFTWPSWRLWPSTRC